MQIEPPNFSELLQDGDTKLEFWMSRSGLLKDLTINLKNVTSNNEIVEAFGRMLKFEKKIVESLTSQDKEKTSNEVFREFNRKYNFVSTPYKKCDMDFHVTNRR